MRSFQYIPASESPTAGKTRDSPPLPPAPRVGAQVGGMPGTSRRRFEGLRDAEVAVAERGLETMPGLFLRLLGGDWHRGADLRVDHLIIDLEHGADRPRAESVTHAFGIEAERHA